MKGLDSRLHGNDENMFSRIFYDSIKTGKLSKLILLLTSYFLLLAPIISSSSAHAATQWSLSVVEGYFLPRLDDLNYILKYQAVELGPRNTEARPSPYPVIYQGLSPEGMPQMRPMSLKSGLQIQADINPRYALVFGGTMAAFESTKRDIRPFFVGFSIPATRMTRFSLSLNQFWFGVKRYWEWKEGPTEKAKKKESGGQSQGGAAGEGPGAPKNPAPRIYAEMGILAITRAYLTTDVWLHVYAPEEGFDFYKITETGSSGNGYTTYLGIGGEYYLRKWLSIGMDIDYMVGGVGDIRFVHYFTVDPLEKDIIKEGDKVLYTDFKKGRVQPLFIDLEGWDLKSNIRVHF